MSDYYDAFEVSPVPPPGPDAVAPDLFRGIYGMPAFVTVTTRDLAGSIDFWTRGMGFFELFAVPGRLVHLRRWAFQDVLLVPAPADAEPAPPESGVLITFACILSQLDALVADVRAVGTGTVGEPHDTPWNTRDAEIVTPEGARVVFTAAKPFDAESDAARNLAAMGIVPTEDEHNGPRA